MAPIAKCHSEICGKHGGYGGNQGVVHPEITEKADRRVGSFGKENQIEVAADEILYGTETPVHTGRGGLVHRPT